MEDERKQSKTLFVRNLPYSTTNETLESMFEDIGPIKQCFVVKEKGSQTCRGFGYVKFSLIEDAVKAKDSVKSHDGRKLFVTFADPKPKRERKRKAGLESSDDKDDLSQEEAEQQKDKSETPVNKSPLATRKTESTVKKSESPTKNRESTVKKSESPTKNRESTVKKNESPTKNRESTVKKSPSPERESVLPNDRNWRARSVVVTGFDSSLTKHKVDSLFTCVKRLEHTDYPSTQGNHSAILKFTSVKDAKLAIKKLQNKTVQGYKLTAVQLSDQITPQPNPVSKMARLIVRNLSFQCSENQLQKVFVKFGEITEVKIPVKADGKKCGFGFVQFADVEIAREAITQMNGKPIGGRPIAVDWAIPKDKFIAASKKDVQKEPESVTSHEQLKPSKHDSDGEQNSVADDDDDDDGADDVSDDDGSDSGSEEEATSNDDEDLSTSEDEGYEDDDRLDEKKRKNQTDTKKEKTSNKTEFSLWKVKSSKTLKSDVDEGRTLFMRNVPFSSTTDELSTVLGEYGEVVYCTVVMDSNTSRPRGTAFVQFKTKDDADNCLTKAMDSSKEGGVFVSGRQLLITRAVTKNKADELTKKEKKKDSKDSRNLYLAREGLIRPGTQDAKGLSQTDIAKRTKVFSQMREKLKNPSIYVSSTRLSVHNLPTSVDDKQLKKLLLQAVAVKSATIKECRIMRDMNRVNLKGVGKSRGYGFVEFTEHQHALKALRVVNNNPELLQEHQRIIVHFSLENKQALAAKERRVQRLTQRQESVKKVSPAAVDTKDGDVKKIHRKPGKSEETLQLKEQNRIAKELYTGPKGLPKHFGPKVRHKPRVNSDSMAGNSDKRRQQKTSHKQDAVTSDVTTEPARKRRKRGKPEVRDNFDKLVNKYKQQLLGAQHKRKWFDS